MKNRENNSRDSRREATPSKPRSPHQTSDTAASEDLKMHFTDQDQELAAESVVRSDNPDNP